MPEQIERVLKAIHVLFSKSDMYMNLPDKIILNKREMFELLEQLNYAVMGVMEEHEATLQARERARKVLEQEQQELLAQTEEQAEEIYAAAMLYTDGALEDAQAVMEQARAQLKAEFMEFDEQMELRFAQLKENQSAIAEQLSELRAHKTYLELIRQQEARELTGMGLAEAIKKEEAAKEQAARPASKGGRRKKQSQTSASAETARSQAESANEVSKAEAERPQAELANEASKAETVSEQLTPTAEAKEAEEDELPTVVLPDELWEEDTPRQKIEVKVQVRQPGEDNVFARQPQKRKKGQSETEELGQEPSAAQMNALDEPAFYRAEDFNLDMEYEQWREQQEGKEVSKAESKRHFLFGRKK